MIAPIGSSGRSIEIHPVDITDLASSAARAKIGVAVLKMEQDFMRVQGEALARMLEPHKGGNVDARA
jgi:hypothetical protein